MFPTSRVPSATTVTELQALRATGAAVARSDSFWGTAEPQPPVNGMHTYNWTYDDGVVSALSRAGLRWQPIVDYATWWAANNGGSSSGVAAGHVGDYAAYAAALATRYGRNGTFWAQNPQLTPESVGVFEIWNEENLAGFWGPKPEPALYASLYLRARAAIKAVDPEATVLIGGLAALGQPLLPMLKAMIQARPDLVGNVDGLAIHPYGANGDTALSRFAAAEVDDRATVNAPLYINEFGWSATPKGWEPATEADRDVYIEQMIHQLAQDSSVADVELYCWGGRDGLSVYGTPGAAAFATALAAVEPAAAITPTRPSTGTPTTATTTPTAPTATTSAQTTGTASPTADGAPTTASTLTPPNSATATLSGARHRRYCARAHRKRRHRCKRPQHRTALGMLTLLPLW